MKNDQEKMLWCPNCGSVEFTECADVATVNRDFRVPADSSKHIQYGHEYSSGDIDYIEYMCHKCGLRFEAHDEEDFREDLQSLNDLFNGPVWVMFEGTVVKGTCKEVDEEGALWISLDNGKSVPASVDSMYKTQEDAEKAVAKVWERRLNEAKARLEEDAKVVKSLENELSKLKKENKNGGKR